MLNFVWGANAFAFLFAGILFLKAWTRTSERLFLIFAAAFGLFALERVVMMGVDGRSRYEEALEKLGEAIRLLGYILIIGAIVEKNRQRRVVTRK